MEDLQGAIRRHYNLIPLELKPHGPVWRVQTSTGSFLLKQMKCTGGRLIWLAESIQKLISGGFNGLTPILPTKSGSPYFIFKSHNYIVTPWHSGDHPFFTHPAHLKQTSALLGKLHYISEKVLLPDNYPLPNPEDHFQKKLIFLKTLVTTLQKKKNLNRIDRSILQWSSRFMDQARFCLEELYRLKQEKHFSTSLGQGFCHKDPAPHNIIIQNTGWILIDYELSEDDYLVTDLVTLLQRALSLNQWDTGLVNLITDAYAAVRKLSNEEYRFILITLCFPRKFWRLCSQRFEEKLDWTEKHYQSKFWALYNEEPKRMVFLRHHFPDLE